MYKQETADFMAILSRLGVHHHHAKIEYFEHAIGVGDQLYKISVSLNGVQILYLTGGSFNWLSEFEMHLAGGLYGVPYDARWPHLQTRLQ